MYSELLPSEEEHPTHGQIASDGELGRERESGGGGKNRELTLVMYACTGRPGSRRRRRIRPRRRSKCSGEVVGGDGDFGPPASIPPAEMTRTTRRSISPRRWCSAWATAAGSGGQRRRSWRLGGEQEKERNGEEKLGGGSR